MKKMRLQVIQPSLEERKKNNWYTTYGISKISISKGDNFKFLNL